MGTVLDSHFLALTAIVTVSKSLVFSSSSLSPVRRSWMWLEVPGDVIGVLGIFF